MRVTAAPLGAGTSLSPGRGRPSSLLGGCRDWSYLPFPPGLKPSQVSCHPYLGGAHEPPSWGHTLMHTSMSTRACTCTHLHTDLCAHTRGSPHGCSVFQRTVQGCLSLGALRGFLRSPASPTSAASPPEPGGPFSPCLLPLLFSSSLKLPSVSLACSPAVSPRLSSILHPRLCLPHQAGQAIPIPILHLSSGNLLKDDEAPPPARGRGRGGCPCFTVPLPSSQRNGSARLRLLSTFICKTTLEGGEEKGRIHLPALPRPLPASGEPQPAALSCSQGL